MAPRVLGAAALALLAAVLSDVGAQGEARQEQILLKRSNKRAYKEYNTSSRVQPGVINVHIQPVSVVSCCLN